MLEAVVHYSVLMCSIQVHLPGSWGRSRHGWMDIASSTCPDTAPELVHGIGKTGPPYVCRMLVLE